MRLINPGSPATLDEDIPEATVGSVSLKKKSVKQLLIDKWTLPFVPDKFIPSNWLAFVLWGRYAYESWNFPISIALDIAPDQKGCSRVESKALESADKDKERSTETGRGIPSATERNQKLHEDQNALESANLELGLFYTLQEVYKNNLD